MAEAMASETTGDATEGDSEDCAGGVEALLRFIFVWNFFNCEAKRKFMAGIIG